MTESRHAEMLHPVRQFAPDDPSTVDVPAAVRAGRRHVRVHRTVSAVGCVLALIGLVLALVSVSNRGGHSPTTVTAFDVATREFVIDSVGDFTPTSYETGRYQQSIRLRAAESDATVTMFAASQLPYVAQRRWEPVGKEAADVSGNRALWPETAVLNSDAIELAWEWSPNAWAIASLRGPQATPQVAHSLASRVGSSPSPATAPVTVEEDTLGRYSILIGTTLSLDGAAARGVGVRYGVKNPPQSEDEWISVTVRQTASDPDEPTTVAGRAAVTDDTSIAFHDGSGVAVVASSTAVIEDLGGFDAFAELAAAVIPLRDSDWETSGPSSAPLSPSPSPPS